MINRRKTRASQSLTRTLSIAFLALSVGVLVVSTAVQLYTNFQSQQASIYARQQLIAKDASRTVSNFFQEKFQVLETAVDLVNPIETSTRERNVVLDSLLGLQPSFRQVTLLNENNEILASASRLSQISAEPISGKISPEGFAQIQQGEKFISPVYIDDATSEPLIIMAIPVTNLLREFQGTLVVEVNLKFMWDVVDQLQVGETGYAYVADSEGHLLAFKDTSRVLSGENIGQIEEVDEFINNPSISADITPDVASYTGLLGTSVVGTYVPLGTPDWAVFIEIPTQEAYQGSVADGIRSLLFILLVAILASVVGVYIARRLAEPLTQLTNTANEIASGSLELQATTRGSTEIRSLAVAFNTMTSQLRNLIGSLEQRVTERTADIEVANQKNERRARQFEAVAQVARATTTAENLDELLPHLTSVISDQFGFYHTGVFLLDESRTNAILRASNSEGGKRMLARKHKLQVGQAGIVGFVSATGNPRIALDVGSDAVFFDNPDLPNTRSELALPLRIAGEITGVLDVQSTESNAFQQEDVEVLSTLADQVSVAIQNALAFQGTQERLSEAQKVSSSYFTDAWRVLETEETHIGYRVYGDEIQMVNKPLDSIHAKKAVASKQTITESGTSATLAVPIRLRDEVIGVMDIRTPFAHEWDEDEVDIAEAVAERLSLALESSLLLKSTQKRAELERITAEISGKIGSTTQFQSILRTAAEELSRVLGGSDVLVQIQSLETPNGSDN